MDNQLHAGVHIASGAEAMAFGARLGINTRMLLVGGHPGMQLCIVLVMTAEILVSTLVSFDVIFCVCLSVSTVC